MEITLSPEDQTFAEQKVASGEFASLSELFSAALRRMPPAPPMVSDDAQPNDLYADTEWTIAEINQMMDESDARFERGEYITVPREKLRDFFDDIIARGEQRFKALEANQ